MNQNTGIAIFDLDGTLTVPVLDFDAIRAETGLPDGPILESVDRLSHGDRQAVLDILHRYEERAARESVLQEGARETLDALRAAGWPIAVLTRNARRWSHVVFEKHDLRIDALRTRDDGVIKPSPQPVLDLCAELKADAQESWMIGDHLFDIQSGRAAGCTTALLLSHDHQPAYANEADHVLDSLAQLIDLMA